MIICAILTLLACVSHIGKYQSYDSEWRRTVLPQKGQLCTNWYRDRGKLAAQR